MNLRIAMVIQAYLPRIGGAERQIANLAPILQAHGCEVHVITRRFPGLSSFEIIQDVPVHRLPVPGPKAFASFAFTLSALPLIQKLRPALIHAHEMLSPTTTAVAAKRAFNIPVLTKILRGGLLGDIAKLKRKTFGRRRIEMFRRHVDIFITISREIDRELVEIGVPRIRRRFIPNGVDTEKFAPAVPEERRIIRATLNLPPQAPIIIYTGRLAAEKRVDQLLEVWPAIKQVHQQAMLLILGSGEEEAALKKQAIPGVTFVGNVENVASYLKAADLFVLPSSTEGLSNALLEALSCALPAVATIVGGSTDVITHGENGWLVPAEQPRFLQDAMLMLLADPARRASLGRSARQRIIDLYALPVVANRLLALYEEIAGTPHAVLRQRAMGA